MTTYDAIVVGARCGGAPLAMLLARAGHRVLLLDRMAFGSDIMSTHYVKRSGAAHLARWGLLDKLTEQGTPAIRQLDFRIDDIELSGQAPATDGVDADYTPRRFILDQVLVDAAIQAGVEVRDRFTVKELLFEGGRVVGTKGIAAGGKTIVDRAKVVVGADGIRSKVADAVCAQTYVDAGTHTCGHYAYFSGMRDRDNAASLVMLTKERRFYITFPTNAGLDLVFLFWPSAKAKSVRSDLDAAFKASLKHVPELEARVHSGRRETRISGTHVLPNHFRCAHGPGWALVGDAALHRDPITAQGITNAFTHAAILAEELNEAFTGAKTVDDAVADYDARQHAELRPMFDYTVHLAKLQPMPDVARQLLHHAASDPLATAAFLGAFVGSVPLDAVFPPAVLDAFGISNGVRPQRGLTPYAVASR